MRKSKFLAASILCFMSLGTAESFAQCASCGADYNRAERDRLSGESRADSFMRQSDRMQAERFMRENQGSRPVQLENLNTERYRVRR